MKRGVASGIGPGGYPFASVPAFSAYKSANSTNATGNGTNFTIICDTEIYDRGAVHNSSTGVVTSPIDSIWQVNATYATSNSPTGLFCKIVTSNRTYRGIVLRPSNAASAGGDFIASFSEQPDLDAADTMYMEVTGTGAGSDNATVSGGSSPQFCHWSGRLVG